MVPAVPASENLDIVPEHVAEPLRKAPWRRRLVTGSGDVILSLALNGAVLAGMLGIGFPLRLGAPAQAISVELVDKMPGVGKADGEPGTGAASSGKPDQADSATKVAEADKVPENQAPAPAAPKPPEPTPSKPEQAETVKPPETAPQSGSPSPEDAQAAASAEAVQPPAASAIQPAVPPPPERPNDDPRARLVEAPSAPPVGQTPSEAKPQTAAEAPAREAGPTPSAVEAQKPVTAASNGDEAVPAPSPPPEAPKPPTAEQQRQAQNTALLAAMLPFGSSIGPDPMQASPASQGQGESTAYRGQVYANFNKAQDVIADAKARHLKGQAVVAFTVDDKGNIASIGIAVSSRNPAVDQAALELIRRAAPFPPPPPGAQRSFSPAIGLGLDD